MLASVDSAAMGSDGRIWQLADGQGGVSRMSGRLGG